MRRTLICDLQHLHRPGECQQQGVRETGTGSVPESKSSLDEDRPLRLYDAGTEGSGEKAKKSYRFVNLVFEPTMFTSSGGAADPTFDEKMVGCL